MTETTPIRLINRTGRPLVLLGSRDLAARGVPFPPLCGETTLYELDVEEGAVPGGYGPYNGPKDGPFMAWTVLNDQQVAADLPPVTEGVLHVLPRELVFACRSLQRRPDVRVVSANGGLATIRVDDSLESLMRFLLTFNEARFLLTQDPNLTLGLAYQKARGIEGIDVWAWHYMLDVKPLGRTGYENGMPAPAEAYIGEQAIQAVTQIIGSLREDLKKAGGL